MSRYHVILRACDRVASVHGKPRPFGLEKRELLELCFTSLHTALRAVPHDVTVIGDRLSDEARAFFRSFDVELVEGEFGNGPSMQEALRRALALPDDDWVYLAEDDHLHQPHAFAWLDELIENRETYLTLDPRPRRRAVFGRNLERRELCLFLPDYPDRYRARYRAPSFVFRSAHCHWRQVDRSTLSFIARPSLLRPHARALDAAVARADDADLSKILYGGVPLWRRALLLSPIPGLATHMHEETMTPGVDWPVVLEGARRARSQRQIRAATSSR